jgi:hypothetical protein
MQGKAAHIRPKVVRPFTGPYANGSYVHQDIFDILENVAKFSDIY